MISRVYPPDPPRAPADISQGVPEDEEEVIKEVAAILKRLQLTQLRTDRLMRGLQALSEKKEENQFPLDDDSSIDDCVAWMIQTTAHTEAEFAVAFINEGAISAIDIRDQSSYRLDWYDEEELSERINEEVGERIRNAREALDDC